MSGVLRVRQGDLHARSKGTQLGLDHCPIRQMRTADADLSRIPEPLKSGDGLRRVEPLAHKRNDDAPRGPCQKGGIKCCEGTDHDRHTVNCRDADGARIGCCRSQACYRTAHQDCPAAPRVRTGRSPSLPSGILRSNRCSAASSAGGSSPSEAIVGDRRHPEVTIIWWFRARARQSRCLHRRHRVSVSPPDGFS